MKLTPIIHTFGESRTAVNPTTEPLRKDECLCESCGLNRPATRPGRCKIIAGLDKVRGETRHTLKLMVTQCPDWVPARDPQPKE